MKKFPNKLISVMIVAAMLLSVVPASVFADKADTSDDLTTIYSYGYLTYYINDDNTITIYGCNPSAVTIDIPSEIDGNSVTSIGSDAFYDCDSLTSINIPNGVTSIGSSAFAYCRSLTSLTIPDSVTSIGYDAFYYCNSLTNINIPNGVTSIGSSVFSNCSNLTSITIPNSVTLICYDTFLHCINLSSINVEEDNPKYSSMNGVLFNKDKTVLVCCPGAKTGTYTIPNSVKNIGNYAFSDCSSLTSINIPDSVTSIGNNAFSDCSALTGINLPNKIVSIGIYAFSGCNSLTSITIPNSVISIKYGAFNGCNNLTNITIPNSITIINTWMLVACKGLTNITIPNSVTSIDRGAFDGCSNLTSITIPNSVTSIQWEAFSGCSSLTNVYYSGTEEEWNNIDIGSSNEDLTNAVIHYNSNVSVITPISDKINVTKDINGDKFVFTVTPVEGETVDLSGIQLFAAEYSDDYVVTDIKSGINEEFENGVQLTVDIPQSENYKLYIWDDNMHPLIEAVQ